MEDRTNRTAEMDGVDRGRVGAVVQSFVEDGYTEICARANADGKWTVTATRH